MSTDRIPKVGEVWTSSYGEALECRHVEAEGALWRWPDGYHGFRTHVVVQKCWTPPKEPLPELVWTELWVKPSGFFSVDPPREAVARLTIRRTADGQSYEIVDFEDLR